MASLGTAVLVDTIAAVTRRNLHARLCDWGANDGRTEFTTLRGGRARVLLHINQ